MVGFHVLCTFFNLSSVSSFPNISMDSLRGGEIFFPVTATLTVMKKLLLLYFSRATKSCMVFPRTSAFQSSTFSNDWTNWDNWGNLLERSISYFSGCLKNMI